ncbi:TetR/AcrR family transcriptional regulator [Solimonas terrae]|uniref:TetR/AcrR family transcriptional regulator n=1 Tax=Solimonas terrae TaxID=1396819 RepID=A0A6M2BWI4_9GAMM|nr:TetR/AcrR family transcriptional regulator [Solimonas terrae]NGY07002.1 TetR/AcrR family transcriptional regulator [Solimonas terrae]
MSTGPAPARRRLSASARREQIIDSARAVWCRAGAQRTTVREIASEAGITEHFVYQHFASREEIFQLAVLAPRNEALRRLRGRLRDVVPGRVGALHDIHCAFLAELPALIPLLSAAQFADPVDGPRFYGSVLLPMLGDSMQASLAAMSGLAPGSLQMGLAIRALVGMHFGIALESVLEEESVNVARVAASLKWITGSDLGHVRRDGLPALPAARTVRPRVVPMRLDDMPIVGRKQLPRAERTAVILEAARAVFLARGLRGARSRDLAQRAGITEAFLLRIYRSKQQLYDDAVLKPLSSAFASLAMQTKALRSTTVRADIPEAYLRLAVPFFASYGALFVGALFSELGEARRYFHAALVPHLREIETTLAVALPGGVDPRVIRRAISGACWAVNFGEGECGGDRIVEMLTVLLKGCAAGGRSRLSARARSGA